MSTRLRVVLRATALLVAVLVCPLTTPVLRGQTTGDLPALLRGRIEALRAGAPLEAADERLLARSALPAFYEGRGFEPAWVTTAGPGPRVAELLDAIERAGDHGLRPEAYHLSALRRLSGGQVTRPELAELELLASDAFLVLGSHLLQGRVNPESIDPEWLANRRRAELHVVLDEAFRSGDISGTLYALAPQQPRYRAMVDAAARLRRVAGSGGWPVVPSGDRLEPGSTGERVALLADRLRASGDLSAESSAGEGEAEFDASMEAAVRRFQGRHGLEPDGVVGPATLAALNVPAAQRAEQVLLNLERWRWLPADLGDRHIEVNIAGFDVKVVEAGRTVRRHRAIVGREYRQTPIFTGSMTYLVLSPYWHVPPNIAALDKLPVIREDPATLANQRLTVLDQRTSEPVDPAGLDWSSLTGPEFNRLYRLRQDPGPSNALGAVKFMFPNRHNVYLHDTPSRELFDRASRSFSSGCIRVEDPLALAEYLLADQSDWDRTRIDQVVAGGTERTVRLTSAIPVHLLYWTAWADADGVMHFRPDVYGRDPVVSRALAEPPPEA